MKNQIVFLDYINRSGSTYLSKLLDQYSDVDVSIEIDLPLVLFSQSSFESNGLINNIINEVINGKKFKAWNVSPKDYSNLILSNPKIGLATFINSLLTLYYKDNKDGIKIFKSGFFIEFYELIREIYPNSKFLYIMRDPRAILNSQKKSKSIEMKFMAKTPILLSFITKKVRVNKKSFVKNHFYMVKYEDLIFDSQNTINGILKYLNVENSIIKSQEELHYFSKIPANQKKLHQNLKKPPLINRVNAWENELSEKDIYFLQKYLQKELIALNYQIVKTNCKISIYQRVKFFLVYNYKKIVKRMKYKFFISHPLLYYRLFDNKPIN